MKISISTLTMTAMIFACSIKANTSNNSAVFLTKIIYVDASKPLGGDGKTWTSAYKYLQDAIDEAPGLILGQTTDVEIWVAQGTYFPDEDEGGNVIDGDRGAYFTCHNNVKIYGGFANGDNFSKRNWIDHPTILSGNINDVNLSTDNSYHIFLNSGVDATASISGFTLADGQADGTAASTNQGGGIYNISSSPTISFCIFKSNKARLGGAIYNRTSNPTISNSIFYGNIVVSVIDDGAVMYNDSSEPEIVNCTITSNAGNSCIYNTANNGSYTVNIVNSILWQNGTEIKNANANVSTLVSYSIVQGGYSGTNNLNLDPQFINQASEDYRLSICSPALNTGDNSSNNSSFDYYHNSRIQLADIDIGAYEHMGVIYVDKDAAGVDNGTAWADAFVYLQDAFTLARACQNISIQIWVADGMYKPDRGQGYILDHRALSYFELINNVSVYGGFSGVELSLSSRDWTENETVLSGDLGTSYVDDTDNAYHVVLNFFSANSQLNNTAILDGFTIEDGYGDGGNPYNRGSAVYNFNASPIIRNCVIQDNYASYRGGAIYNENSVATFSNCLIVGNVSNGHGSVAYNFTDGDASFINCTMDENTSVLSTSFYNENSAPEILNTIIWGDDTQIYDVGGSPNVTNCFIKAGYAPGVNIYNADPDFEGSEYELSHCSPAIGKGNNTYNSESKDLLGNNRVVNTNIDIGAYEHQQGFPKIITYVNGAASGANDGQSWVDAHTYLQDALGNASNYSGCTEVWVAEGIYYPDEGLSQVDNDRSSSFEMAGGLKMYGGFQGLTSENQLSDRDWQTNETILSGDIDKNDATVDNSNNSYHVIFNSYESGTDLTRLILDGFTVTGGHANMINGVDYNGAGMYNRHIDMNVDNCIFVDNYALFEGGGIYGPTSDIDVTKSQFIRNTASNSNAGAIAWPNDILQCIFIDNYSGGKGGAVLNSIASRVENCIFYNNHAEEEGGAIFCLNWKSRNHKLYSVPKTVHKQKVEQYI